MRGMFNYFVISKNQKKRLFSGLELICMGAACSLRGGGAEYSPMTSAAHTCMLERWEGKYPIIHFQMKTRRSSLMWAFGRDIILSNKKAPTKTHQAVLLNNIKTQTTFKIHI